jgi:acyl-coenzyme A thioesterase PaaI-like protein
MTAPWEMLLPAAPHAAGVHGYPTGSPAASGSRIEHGQGSEFKVSEHNPDHVLLLDFLERGGAPREFDVNPVAADYRLRLLAADRGAGTVRLGFELAQRHCQGNRVVQGGVLGVLLDFGIALAVMTQLPLGASAGTVSLSTQIMRAAGPGPGTISGRVERCGRTLAFGAAELHGADGKAAIATASAVMALLSAR